MKQFILEVQEGYTECYNCPFIDKTCFKHICDYLYENNICHKYDFSQINIEECDERS